LFKIILDSSAVYVLLLTSPRVLSASFINELGNVISTFLVLSLYVVLAILILYIVSHSYKSIAPSENFLTYVWLDLKYIRFLSHSHC